MAMVTKDHAGFIVGKALGYVIDDRPWMLPVAVAQFDDLAFFVGRLEFLGLALTTFFYPALAAGVDASRQPV
jgi:hypothetical protein